MHVNYRYLIEMARRLGKPSGTLLDVGCGKGDMVQLAIDKNWRARGLEYFGPGSGTNIREQLMERGLLGGTVLEYDGRTFPFEDDTFDIVLSNQVFEHVPDLDRILSEVARVLKPGGHLICTFPYQDAIREGHSNVLFAHWFPKSRLRIAWLYAFRSLGIGRLKRNRTKLQWARFFNDFLETDTCYLTGREVRQVFSENFDNFEHLEESYIAFRLEEIGRKGLARFMVSRGGSRFARWICRNFGSLVIVAEKSGAADGTGRRRIRHVVHERPQ